MYSGSGDISWGWKVCLVNFSSLCKTALQQLFSRYPGTITELIICSLLLFISFCVLLLNSILIFLDACFTSAVSQQRLYVETHKGKLIQSALIITMWSYGGHRNALFWTFSSLGQTWYQVLFARERKYSYYFHRFTPRPCCCWRQPVEDERVSKQPKQVATSVSLRREQPQLSLSRLVLSSVTLQTYAEAPRF